MAALSKGIFRIYFVSAEHFVTLKEETIFLGLAFDNSCPQYWSLEYSCCLIETAFLILHFFQLLLRSLREREQVESDLQKLTESVELGKKSLLDALRFMEGHSQRLLAQLTSQSEERAKQVKFYEEELRKSDLSWKTLLPKLEISKRNLVLSAMKAHLKEDNHFNTTYKRLVEVSKNEVDRMINAHKAEEKLFGPLLAKKQVEQENIINGLLEDENVQREMFRVLQLRSDAVHNRILCDLVMLENELTTLSLLEVQQTEDRGAIIKKSLEDERMELAKMYQRLIKEREHREAYLKGTFAAVVGPLT